MSKKESVREGIGTARNLLLAFLTAIFGVFGYGIVHIDDLTKNQMLCGIIALCLCGHRACVDKLFYQNQNFGENAMSYGEILVVAALVAFAASFACIYAAMVKSNPQF